MSAPAALRELLADIARQDFPALNTPPGPHSYRVVAVRSDGRCDLQAVKDGPPPTIANVDHWTSSGTSSKPVVGSIVVVSFLDGDPAQPMIGAYQPLRVAGGAPTLATLDATTIKIGPTAAASIQLAGTGPAVARVGDTASGGVLAVAMVGPAPMFTYTPPGGVPGVPSATITISCVIASGSAKVTSG